ncbi:TetR/AcrR family transcriptional regulator [Microbacterium sp. NPDC056052]|uniref:TetR/AcrR family transcriptional regulator n=1 Tax=Microbacterium sp. NPDC056052 TaxID=3345695 RepID=UPI0035D89381
MTTESAPGRRERNMIEKRERISAAASELFAVQGYEPTTTQQIADLADVSIGTVFRYATTKAELLLMVRNAEFARAVLDGLAAADRIEDVERAVLAAIEPVVSASRTSRDVALYQRELMFGPVDEPYRAEGLATVMELEEGLAAILSRPAPVDQEGRDAAGAVFAVVHLAIVRAGIVGASAPDLVSQVRQIVAGHRAVTESRAGGARRGEGQ